MVSQLTNELDCIKLESTVGGVNDHNSIVNVGVHRWTAERPISASNDCYFENQSKIGC